MAPKNNFVRVFKIARPFWGRLFGISIIILVLSVSKNIFPLITKSIFDIISKAPTTFFLFKKPTLLNLLVLYISLRLTLTLLNQASMYAASILRMKLSHHMRQIGFKHILTLSIDYFNKTHSGKIMSRISRGVDGVRSIISSVGTQLIPGIVTAIVAVIIVMRFNLVIGIASITMFLPYWAIKYWRFKALSSLEKKQNRIWDREYSHFWEVVSNIRIVKSFCSEHLEIGKLHKVTRKLIGNNYKMEKINNQSVVSDIITDIWTFGIFTYIVYLGYNGTFTVGTMFLMWQYSQIIREPLFALSWIYWDVRYAEIGIKDYIKILDQKSSITEVNHPITLEKVKGKIEFNNVWFIYPEKGGQEVFKGLNLSVEPGKTLAMVGRSGVGKTTVANLMIRFFDPNKGSIKIDGIDIRDLSLKSLRDNVVTVMQESFLFADTIAENLRYAKANASEEELEVACRVANAWEFIDKLPKKLNTLIGERGIRLSGGQKQRLSIARTVLKNPKILILDEATSALDSHSEMLVQDAIEKLINGRTTIIIAHRLSTIQKADSIVVLDKKKVVESGTHAQLVKEKGIYASLHAIQTGHLERLKHFDLIS